MRTYLARRLLAVIPLLLAVTFLTQALLVASPGNYFDTLASQAHLSPELLDLLKRQYRLDTENVVVRYGHWLMQALRGNFGYSFRHQLPVWSLVWERAGYTLLLAAASLALAWGLAIPGGVLAAAKRGTWVDRLVGLVSFCGLSMPAALSSLLVVWAAAKTGWLPLGGAHDQVHWDALSPLERAGDVCRHLALPAFVLGLSGWAEYVRQVRGAMLETLAEDYVRTATAKGLGRRRVLFRHALRNAANPLVTLFGFSLAYLLAGAVLVEHVFAWPGMGRLTVEAVVAKDEPLVMASAVLLTLMLVAGNLVADILLALIDPRVRMN